jgi:hypothetical protein
MLPQMPTLRLWPVVLACALLTAQEPRQVILPGLADGQPAATWYAVGPEAPSILCIAGSAATVDLGPLAAALAGAGIQVLVLAPRSVPPPAPADGTARAAAGPEAAAEDIAAALGFLRAEGADTTRLALLAGGDSALSAIQAGLRERFAFRALVLLAPGEQSGRQGATLLQQWPGAPALIAGASADHADADAFATALLHTDTDLDRITLPVPERGGSLARQPRAVACTTRFLVQTLGSPVLRIPAFQTGDERTSTPGFIHLTCRVARTSVVDGKPTRFTLLAFVVGDTLTLGAMTDGTFVGDVAWAIGKVTISMPWDSSGSRPVEGTVHGNKDLQVTGKPASFRGTSWINIELPKALVMPEDETTLRLELRARGAAIVRLPGGEHPFTARLLWN